MKATASQLSAPPRTNLGRTAGQNIAATYLTFIITAITPFVLIPLYTRLLGREVYGEWVVIMSMTSYLGLANMGTWQAVGNRIAESFGLGRSEEVGRVVSTAFLSYLLLSVGLALIFWSLARSITAYALPRAQPATAGALALYASLSLLAWAPRTYGMALRSYERVDLEQRVSAASELLRLAGISLALLAGFKLLAIGAIQGLIPIIYGFACWGLARRIGPEMHFRLSQFSRAVLGSLLKPSVGFFFLDLGWQINFGLDNLVIGHFLGAEAVTRYSVPMRLVLAGSALFGIGVSSLRPTITVQYSQRDNQTLTYGFLFAMRLALLWGCGGLIALWLLGPAFLRLWAGTGVFPGFLTFGLQLALFLIMVLILPSQNVLLATNRHYDFAKLCIIEAAINLSLSLWWVRHLGLAGVIGATVVARLLTNAWFVPFVAFKTLELSVHRVARELAPATIISMTALVVAATLPQLGIGNSGPVIMIGLTAFVLGGFVSAFWMIGTTVHDRAIAGSLLGGLFGRHSRAAA